MIWKRRKYRPRDWEIKVTNRDGTLLHVTTEDLEVIWRSGNRSNDGYVDLLDESLPARLHLWVRPAGHVEPDRSRLLDGTAALPYGLRSRM